MKLAIMQPTYIPWIGYFGLMHYVDIFVLLDSVQFERRSWQQRNKIKTFSGEKLLTIPVFKKGKRDQLINEVKVELNTNFQYKHSQLIKQSYCNAPFFKQYYKKIFSDNWSEFELLNEITINLILRIKESLGIKTKIYKSSDLSSKGKKFLNICS